MAGDPTQYTNLITSEHNQAPNFMAMVELFAQAGSDTKFLLETLSQHFDIDVAIGKQLDIVGEWVGRTRFLSIPLAGVYFSLDEAGVGLDEGTWKGPFDPATGLVELPDDTYRTLLRTVIAANQWDGTIPGAYSVWSTIFSVTGSNIAIVDHQDMTMDVLIFGAPLNAVIIALLTTGQIALKPAGVRITYYFVPSVPTAPAFGLDAESAAIAGLDEGAWVSILTP
jgi:hypothetical protein